MSTQSFSILVVEDEILIAKNLVKNISRINDSFDVLSIAKDGKEALDLIETRIPDIVFTDIRMPVMDGLELLRQIDIKYPNIKTVVLSGYNEFEYAKSALAYNARNYLLKPINFQELKETLLDIKKQLIAEKGELIGFQQLNTSSLKEVIKSVRKYIDENYTEHINFSNIAKNLGYSLAYLSRSFTDYYNESPVRYQINLRIRESKKLLLSTDFSIKEISDSLGYSDQFCFSKSFKNEVGISPNKYRSKYNNES